jgi:hypothetical protein
VKDKSKEKDLVIVKNPAEFSKKQDAIREKLSELYYNVKTSTEFSQGINSDAPMTFLSVVGGKLSKSPQPITYNEYIMNILETNIEKGRPVDPKDPSSPFVHFSNPVVTFDVVGDNSAALEDLQETETPTEPSIEPAANEEAGLLDMSLDFGDVAEDIGNIDDLIEPDMKSIKTSLKELKKSCD